MLNLYLYLILYISFVVSKDVVSEETESPGIKKSAKHDHDENRRFYQDLEDEEWHIAHVKKMLLRRSSCTGETYQDRLNKYMKSIRNDGGRIEFVSADPLPITQTESQDNYTCKAENFTDIFIKPNSWKNIKRNLTADDIKSLNDPLTVEGKSSSNDTKSRRSNDEYQFPQDEYYEEEVNFDPNECPPGTLDIYDLDIDHLKPYDIECELTIEWKSLESTKAEWSKMYG